MSPASSLTTTHEPDCPSLNAADRDRHLTELGEAIAWLAARLHAATYELLVLLREFDEQAGWNNGFHSCAHWLLGRLAECVLAAGLDRGTASDRYQVVVHVDPVAVRGGTSSTGTDADAGHAVVELDAAAICVSTETAQRIACDASLVVLHHSSDGAVLDVGRKTRTISAAIRRALVARDRTCQFPGCSARRCDGHHIRHWADGGPTSLDNLVLVCRRHHRAVHEEGFSVERGPDGAVTFFRLDGTRIDLAPAAPHWHHQAALQTLTVKQVADPSGVTHGSVVPPVWRGEPLDIVWALDVLRGQDGMARRQTD